MHFQYGFVDLDYVKFGGAALGFSHVEVLFVNTSRNFIGRIRPNFNPNTKSQRYDKIKVCPCPRGHDRIFVNLGGTGPRWKHHK